MKLNLWLLLFSFFILYSCKQDHESRVDVKIEPLEDVLPAIQTKTQLVAFLTAHPELRDHFFGRQRYPNDSVFINELFRRFTNPHLDTLLAQAHQVFGDQSFLKTQFNDAFTNLKREYPDFKTPKIQTMISGLETDLLVSDTLIVVGLDYYLGTGAKYRPNMYEYMLRRYTREFIVPSVLLIDGIDVHYNQTAVEDRTALADMIAYGKAYYFAKQLLPNTPDSVLIGYTSEEINSVTANEDLIYAHLVDKEVMFSTDHLVKQRYLGERPKTLEISEKCPGRIATWIGWQIVKSYAKNHSGESLSEIMAVQSPQKLFKEAKYKPKS